MPLYRKITPAVYWVVASLFVILLFWGGRQPFAGRLFVSPYSEIAHFSAYAFLGIIFWMGTGEKRPVLVIILVSSIAALDELQQTVIPFRTASVGDFLIDVVAVCITIFLLKTSIISRETIRQQGLLFLIGIGVGIIILMILNR